MREFPPTHSDARRSESREKGEFYVMIHFLESVRVISRKESPSYFDRDRDRLHAAGILAKRGKVFKLMSATVPRPAKGYKFVTDIIICVIVRIVSHEHSNIAPVASMHTYGTVHF